MMTVNPADENAHSAPGVDSIEAELSRALRARLPQHQRSSIRAAILADQGARLPRASRPRAIRLPSRRLGLRLAVPVALMLALGVGAGSFRLPQSHPVSAAQLLRRAAAAVSPTAGQVVHETGVASAQTSAGVRIPGTVSEKPVNLEQWTQVNKDGNPEQIDLSDSATDGSFSYRTVADSAGKLWKVSRTNGAEQVSEGSWTPDKPLFQGPDTSNVASVLLLQRALVDTPQSPSAMQSLLGAAASGSEGEVTMLPQQTIDGRSYDAVQFSMKLGVVASSPGSYHDAVKYSVSVTVYIDPSTYVVRRVETTATDANGNTAERTTIEISKYEIVDPSTVPAGTFAYSPPSGATITAIGPRPICDQGVVTDTKTGHAWYVGSPCGEDPSSGYRNQSQ